MGCSSSAAGSPDRSSKDSGAQSLEELHKFLRDVAACPTLLQAKVDKKRKRSFGENFMEEEPLPPYVEVILPI